MKVNMVFGWLSLLPYLVLSQTIQVDRIDPPNWWVGMKWNTVQVMLYGENLHGISVEIEPEGLPEVIEVTNRP